MLASHSFVIVPFLGLASCQITSPAPSAKNFLRRLSHATTVIGDWLYLDGGEVSQLVDGEPIGYNGHWLYKINHTLSIPLRDSWTTESVVWKLTEKKAPVFLNAALWTYHDTWVNWGGKGSYASLPDTNEPWQFTVDGNGGGEWNPVNPANREDFLGITRTFGTSWATCGGIGLSAGGWAGADTDRSLRSLPLSSHIPTPGLITYDISTRVWSNESAAGLNAWGTSILGSGTCLKELGDAGLFFVIGGEIAELDYWKEGAGLIELRNINFWDVATKTWYSQITTGDAPAPRDRHCMSSVRGPNNTYEIYLYGGHDPNQGVVYDDLWVLSIPLFRWFKVNTQASTKRRGHSCQVVGKHLLSFGGLPFFSNVTDPDEWSQGIGVLDLSSWMWTGQYQADTTYETPQVIRDWYSENDISSNVNWTSEAVKRLFLSNDGQPEDGDRTPDGEGGTPEGKPGGKTATNTPTAAIIGGTIGGIVGLFAIVVALLVLRKRHKKRKSQKAPGELPAAPSHPGTDGRAELDKNEKVGELPGRSVALYALPLSESGGPPVELEGHTPAHPLHHPIEDVPPVRNI